jgi:ketosteroid isomerase-like protein
MWLNDQGDPEGAETAKRRAAADEQRELLGSIERDRVRALVAGDIERAARLHADDFQLINPLGGTVSKAQYLDGIRAGQIRYVHWEPEAIVVRLYGDVAVLRYRSEIEIIVQGRPIPRQAYWHTDLYERRGGQWQVVWSQATVAAPP